MHKLNAEEGISKWNKQTLTPWKFNGAPLKNKDWVGKFRKVNLPKILPSLSWFLITKTMMAPKKNMHLESLAIYGPAHSHCADSVKSHTFYFNEYDFPTGKTTFLYPVSYVTSSIIRIPENPPGFHMM